MALRLFLKSSNGKDLSLTCKRARTSSVASKGKEVPTATVPGGSTVVDVDSSGVVGGGGLKVGGGGVPAPLASGRSVDVDVCVDVDPHWCRISAMLTKPTATKPVPTATKPSGSLGNVNP